MIPIEILLYHTVPIVIGVRIVIQPSCWVVLVAAVFIVGVFGNVWDSCNTIAESQTEQENIRDAIVLSVNLLTISLSICTTWNGHVGCIVEGLVGIHLLNGRLSHRSSCICRIHLILLM